MAAHWRTALERNPSLFNGALVSPLGACVHDGVCTVRWHRSDFAHYLFSRQNPDRPVIGATGTLFVSIIVPTTDGELILGRMSQQTSAPSVIQLPGGGVSVGPDQTQISHSDLTAVAVQETSEELGITLDPAGLRTRGVIKRHSPPDIGVVFSTEPRARDSIQAAFAALRLRDLLAGIVSEFDELFAVSPRTDLRSLSGRGDHVIDYLPVVVGAFLTTGGGIV
ncbi:MAG: hypothetical protein JO272_14130 [Pseudonocardiales bacterium]|nr:hypothetical protein [Pseudonocardiales bacterium]